MREVIAADGTTLRVHAKDVSDWVEIRHQVNFQGWDEYCAYDKSNPEESIGSLQFTRDAVGLVSFQTIGVVPAYQRRGVASALVERFGVDNPGAIVDPGNTTEMGHAILAYGLALEPEVQAYLSPTYVEKRVGY